MTRTLQLLSLSALFLVLTGCVSADSYNALKMDRDRYMEQLATSQTEANAAKAKADALQRQIDAIMGNSGTKEALILNLQGTNADLQARLEELTRKYEAALNRPVGGGPLPPELSNELTAFAQQNPDLVEFDASRGIVKFRSDVTFARGDAELTSKAKDVIARFASILNAGVASQYELMVAGHTDNTRVVNAETIAKGHKDNWYLSAHRAISVGSALVGHGISPARLGVVGYAEQRPLVPNTSSDNMAKNRRVEVLILPTTVRGASVQMATESRVGAPKATAKPNKDAMIETRPALNK